MFRNVFQQGFLTVALRVKTVTNVLLLVFKVRRYY